MLTIKSLPIALFIVASFSAHPLALKERPADDVQPANKQSLDKWVEENYPNVLDRLMPKDNFPANAPRENVKWVMTVRVLSPYEQPETSFSMQRKYGGEVDIVRESGRLIESQTISDSRLGALDATRVVVTYRCKGSSERLDTVVGSCAESR